MKQECEIVRDLMPLVLDDVASDGSKHMVSAHVQTCAQCAAYMNQLKADLPAGKKSELDSRAAFDAAAQTLRKQKRRRTLRNILLGALIVCILGLANLYCFDWLMNETRPISTSEYGIQLSKLADGRLVTSFDYHESMTPLYVKQQQVTETAADGSRAEILYLYAEKHIVPQTASTPMQNTGFTLDSGWQTTTAEIRQGTPEEYQVLWRQEDEDAAIPTSILRMGSGADTALVAALGKRGWKSGLPRREWRTLHFGNPPRGRAGGVRPGVAAAGHAAVSAAG